MKIVPADFVDRPKLILLAICVGFLKNRAEISADEILRVQRRSGCGRKDELFPTGLRREFTQFLPEFGGKGDVSNGFPWLRLNENVSGFAVLHVVVFAVSSVN